MVMAATAGGIVSGYDGSPSSKRALSWAGREAAARDLPLTVCHAYGAGDLDPADGAVLDSARYRGESLLSGCLDHAQCAAGPARVESVLAEGPAAAVLCERSQQAAMVVLGAYGCGRGVPGMPLGSVAAQVATRGRGRIVVVRGHWRAAGAYVPGPIVVGLDGSPQSRAALRFAFEEARLREAPLLAVCALADSAMAMGGQHQLRDDAERVLASLEKENSEVAVLRQVTDCGAITAILMAAREAQLVVLGSRGRGGGLPQITLGSVAQAVVQHAPCPVGIVREH
jgi:nucleotide-binding universal stress UspA family protein